MCNAISHLTEIIKEMRNYQKTIIILEGNVTSDCKHFIPKGVRSIFLVLEKEKKDNNNRRPGDFMRVIFYFYEDIIVWKGIVSSSSLTNMEN